MAQHFWIFMIVVSFHKQDLLSIKEIKMFRSLLNLQVKFNFSSNYLSKHESLGKTNFNLKWSYCRSEIVVKNTFVFSISAICQSFIYLFLIRLYYYMIFRFKYSSLLFWESKHRRSFISQIVKIKFSINWSKFFW